MSQNLVLSQVSREPILASSSPFGVVAQSSPPPSNVAPPDAYKSVKSPSGGAGGQDEKSLGTQLRDAIRSGQDPWVAAGNLLKGSNYDALAKSSDPLLQFFGRYMKAAAKAKVASPSSHREAVGNLKTMLKGMSKADSESLLKSAAMLGLNLGFKPLVDSANKANADPTLVAAFARSFGAQKGAPQPAAPSNTTPNAGQGNDSGVPPGSSPGPSSRGLSNSGPSSGMPNAASGTTQPLTTASGDELTARWLAGESWFDIAAGLIADRAPGSIKPADIEGARNAGAEGGGLRTERNARTGLHAGEIDRRDGRRQPLRVAPADGCNTRPRTHCGSGAGDVLELTARQPRRRADRPSESAGRFSGQYCRHLQPSAGRVGSSRSTALVAR
jgi:hypothetical protein